jgi:hypothetical protein
MEQGGECGDKSRLVAAMLNSLGIDAGLVMIAPFQHCGFIHTVVEAQYEAGRMVVDPTWDVDYPTGDGRFSRGPGSGRHKPWPRASRGAPPSAVGNREDCEYA